MQRCISCTQELVNIPTCRRCANQDIDAWRSSLGRKNTELASEKEKYTALQTSTTLQIDKLKSQVDHEVEARFDGLLSRLAFLSLQFQNESVGSLPKADVVILIKDREEAPLYAHKLILASKSPVFSRMLESEMLEGETGTIRIDDTTLPVMHAVVEFFYRAVIEFTDEISAEDVLAVAHKYGVDLLQTICEERLIRTIDKVNLSRMLKLARKLEATKLEAGVLAFLKNHFDEFGGVIELP